MKRLSVSIIEPVGGYGGMEYYDYGLAYGLASQNIDVSFHTCAATKARSYDHVTTHKTFGNLWSFNKIRKAYLFFKGYKNSFKISKGNDVDIVHLHFFQISRLNLRVLKLAKRYKLKIVLTLHDIDPFVSSASLSLHKQSYALVDKVIVHNNYSKQQIIQKGIDPSKVAVIPHGNYLPFITPVSSVANTEKSFSLLFFGQIKEVKGIDVLLSALNKVVETHPNVELVIAGRPWHTSSLEYEQQIRKLGLSQHVKTVFKYIPNEQVAEFYEAADLVVLPYKRIYQSGVLLLSMSYGRPCLASDLPSFREIIDDGKNGYLFQSESAISLADKIKYIVDHKEELNDVISQANSILKERFDWKKIAEQTKAVYESLINA